ncbi:MAG: hypothetical protein ACD_73C00316G0001 [uncultured bacterium]|nr:MAG: hypothetical protein ACD_73C00316G0001 [uncultured bacterium]
MQNMTMPAPKVKPYSFESVKSFNKTQCLLTNGLASFFNNSNHSRILKALNEKTKKWMSGGIAFQNTSIGVIDSEESLEKMSAGICVEFFHPETGRSFFLFVEREIIFSVAESLLGGSQVTTGQKIVTPLLQSVFEYYILTLLEAIRGDDAVINLRYKGIVPHDEEIWRQVHISQCVLVSGVVMLKKEKFSYGFLMPQEIMSFLKDHEQSLPFKEESLKNFDHLRTLLWAEVGSVSLTPDELGELQKGDVILLDDVVPHYDGKNLTGSMCVGMGEAKFWTKIESDNPLRVKIEKFTI